MRRAAPTEMSEEDEFGMNKPGSFESDPMEIEVETAVKDHPDFSFLSKETLSELGDGAHSGAQWLKNLPVEKDATQWSFLQVQIRPDRAWLIMQELIATVCIGHGMVVAEETPSTVLFRKKVGQDTMAHGMMDAATYQNLFVAIGVLPSKLRVLHLGYFVSNEQKLMGGVKTSQFHTVSEDRMKALNRSMDNLLAALQSTLVSQFLTASYLYMTTPENTAAPSDQSGEQPQLDSGYVSDIRAMFVREMKVNMRELCIPLEEYAHSQEYSCALLLGLLDPLLKKHSIDVARQVADQGSDESKADVKPADASESTTAHTVTSPAKSGDLQSPSTGKPYGEVITDLVHELWDKYKRECDATVKLKIEEKKKQVTARVQAAQKLRVCALEGIINCPTAALTNLKASTIGNRADVLLYDGSCVVNNAPVKLHITYGHVIFRSLVPFLSRTTVIPFNDVVQVAQTTTLGIRAVNLELTASHARGVTIAMGLEVDLLYQLLLEIMEMHKRERQQTARRSSLSKPPVSSVTQFDTPDLETMIAADEEEKEAEDGDEEQDVTLRRLISEDQK